MWAYAHDAGRLAIAVILLISGASKLVSPRPLATSLGEVYGWARSTGTWAARVVAGVELATAFLLAGGWLILAGSALTGVVAAGIMIFSITAIRRKATVPCGCFGEASGRPVGVRNLIAGAALLAGAAGLLLLPGAGDAEAALMLPLTAVIALVAVMARDRARLVAPFRRHFQPPAAGPVTSKAEVS